MMGWGFGGFGTIYMIIFWVIIIAAALWLLSYLFPRGAGNTSSRGTPSTHASADSAQEILDHRYASGEITKAEYDEIRLDLGG